MGALLILTNHQIVLRARAIYTACVPTKNKKDLTRSFRAATRGFWQVLTYEPAFRWMVFAAILVVAGIIFFRTSRSESIALLTMIFAVLGLELINSVFERFLDFLRPEHDERVRIIKDVMAAIVLLVSLGAVVIGLIIFWPYIKNFL